MHKLVNMNLLTWRSCSYFDKRIQDDAEKKRKKQIHLKIQ